MATTRRAASDPAKITFKMMIEEVIVPTVRLTIPVAIMFYPGNFLDGLALLIVLASFPVTRSDSYVIAVACILIYYQLFKITLLAVAIFVFACEPKRIWTGYVVPVLVNVGAERLTKDTSLRKGLLIISQGICHCLLIYYGLWFDVLLLIGLGAVVIECKLPGGVSLGIFFISGMMIYFKIFKAFIGLLCLGLVLGALLWRLFHAPTIRTQLSTALSRYHEYTSQPYLLFAIRLGILIGTAWLNLPEFLSNLGAGRLVWIELFLFYMMVRTIRPNYDYLRAVLSRFEARLVLAHLEGLFKYGILPSVAIILLWNMLGFRPASGPWVFLLHFVLMQLFGVLARRVNNLARRGWNKFMHRLILNHLPAEFILQTPDPTSLAREGAMKVPVNTQLEDFKTFVYGRLSDPQSSFRLFVLDEVPLQLSGILVPSGRLIHASLSNPPQYISVSYSWGNDKDNQPIIIDGMRFSITNALAVALQNIRAVRNGALVLWIDQICIDQKNDAEKGFQVKEMGLIYRQAFSNVAWLGESTSHSNRAFDMVRIMARAMPKEWADLGSGIRNSSNYKPLDKGTFSTDDWNSFENTFEQRKLWSRVWIIQELVLARTIELQCGRRILQWDAVDFVLSAWDLNIQPGRHHWFETVAEKNSPPGLHAIAIVKQHRDILSTTGDLSTDLTQLVVDFQEWNSTEEKDKIYALLSLAADDLAVQPKYDKSIPTKSTFRETTISILKRDKKIDWICGDRSKDVRRHESLPSWVPHYGYFNFLCSYHNPTYSASRGCGAAIEQVLFGDDVLTVMGQHLDCIESVRDLVVDNIPKINNAPGSKYGHVVQDDVWVGIWQSIPSHQICFEELGLLNGAYSDVIWRVLLSDCRADDERLKEEDLHLYRDEFRSWYDAILLRIQRRHAKLIPRLYKYLWERLTLSLKHPVVVSGDVRVVSFPETHFTQSLRRFNSGRRLALTRGKRLISVPWNAEVGDEIAVLYSSNNADPVTKIEGGTGRVCRPQRSLHR